MSVIKNIFCLCMCKKYDSLSVVGIVNVGLTGQERNKGQ